MDKTTTRVIALAAAFLGLMGGLTAGREAQPLVIRGGKIVTVTKGILENGIIIIEDGKIREIGKDLSIPPGARVIEAVKDFVLPGLIDAGTNLGTVEFESVEEDYDEVSSTLTPHLRIIDAFNADNRFIPDARNQGITSVLVAPGRGNLLAGQSAFLRLVGGDVAEMSIKFPAAVHGTLGGVFKKRSKSAQTYPYTRMGAAALLRQTLIDTQDYHGQILDAEKKRSPGKDETRQSSRPALQPTLEALVPVIKGKLPLLITANRYDDILTALRIAQEFKIRIIISEGAEACRVADTLASMKVPVIVRPKNAYGLTVETANAVPENAALLQKAGVKIAFQTGSIRNLGDLLPQAQEAIRHGLAPDDALRALTINPAEIFGVADKVGSLEKGKSADIVIFSEDPSLSSAKVRTVIIRGKEMLL